MQTAYREEESNVQPWRCAATVLNTETSCIFYPTMQGMRPNYNFQYAFDVFFNI